MRLLKQIILVLLFCSCIVLRAQETKVKNVIFLIGDGMGLNQVYAAMTCNGNTLNIERCPIIGLSKTYSSSNYTTDSGAGGTALACGVKTKNGMIGMTADSVPKESIMRLASKAGFATGLVVACNVTHATPASFVAHQINRNMTQEIAADYLNSGIDVFIGGGRDDFEKRKDNRILTDELRQKGYQVLYSMPDIATVKSGRLAGLIADNHPPKANERGNMLLEGTSKAIELLSQNKNGFFLMVEGSQIDWAGHSNNVDEMVTEVLDFDKVVGLALDFAAKDKNTLVIVTADHETGGLALLDGDFISGKVTEKYTTKQHSGMPVPVYSFGVGAQEFSGFMENTSLFNRLIKLYQLR